MTKKNWAIFLFLVALWGCFIPGWNGFLFDPSNISDGEGKIISIISLIGGLLLWYFPNK